ncbi:lsy-12, partial [Pristionchus pacificus]
QPTACNPLAWCPKCYEPKHVRRCELRETTGDEEVRYDYGTKCAACGGQRLQSPTKETASLSPHATCSSASSQVTAMTTPGSEKGKLTDSLSAFFTPTPGGRRRKTTINTHEDSTSDEEPDGRASKLMGPLSGEVGTEGAGGSGTASKTTPSSTTSSSHHHHRRAEEQLHDALSPYFSAASGKRRSAVKGEYARMQQGGGAAAGGGGSQGGHSSGAEAMLSPGGGGGGPSPGLNSPKCSRRGRPPRNPSVASTLGLVGSPTSASTRDEEKEEEDEDGEEEQEQRVKMAVASPRRKSQSTSPSKKRGGGDGEEWRMQGRSTQNSASAALFSSPDDRRGGKGQRKVKKEIESDESEDDAPLRKNKSSRHPPPPQASTATTSKSPLHKRIKRELRSSDEDTTQSDGSDSDDKPLMQRRAAPGSSLRPAAAAAEPSTSRGSPEKKMSKKIKEEPRKSVAVPAANIKPPQSPIDSTGTGVGSSLGGIETWSDIKITQDQWAAYEACTEKANAAIEKTPLLTADGREIPRWPETICFGKWEMETWFTAPYPNEYANTKKLYICEFCLKYMRTFTQLERHAEKCKSWHPPGNEIYRKDDVSVFEVDGNVAGIYCQNLCLLAKLYLDHKTLYYDVEPFLFYIVTKNDETGCHFVGYFSKEKYSAQKFNLSCIVTLPCYHKQGFGRFLIDFSYLLTRREKMVGSPERPLSDLGRVSYAAYWRSALLEYMRQKVKVEKNEGLQFSEIAADTGISLYDATTTMEALGMLVKSENGGMEFLYNEELVERHWTKAHANKGRIWLDETALKWIPVAHTPSKDFAIIVRSPARMVSPTPSHAGVTPTGVPLAACGSTIKRGPLAAANAVPSAAAAAAAASGPTPRKQPGAVKMAEKKRATRQLKLEDVGFGGGATSSSKTSTATPARKSRRIAAASEDSSLASTSSDEEKKKKPESKGTCKPDTGKRRNRRSEDSDSSDEEREGGGGGGGASPKKRPSASGPSSASTRRASGASRGAAAPPASPPKGRKRGGKGGRGRESEDDEEGEVSSAYATTSSDSDDSSDSDSDQDTSFHPQTARRPPPPSKGKKGSKGKPTPQIPQKKGARAAPQKGKKNGVTGTTVTPSAGASTTTSPPSTVAVKGRKKELKSPGKVFPSNYSAMIAARKQQQAAAAAAESAAAPGCSSQAAAAAAGADLAAASTAAAAAGEEDGRPASPADSLCSTATIPMRQATEWAADQSMLTDDGCAHESEGREHTPGPSASALSSRPSSCGRGRKVERRRNGRTRRGETSEDEQSDSSIGGSSSGSSLFRGASPRPMGDRVPSTSGGTMNMGWDEEETDHDRTMRIEQLENGPISAPPVSSSSSSERPPSLQAMSPIEPRVPEEPDQPTLGSLLSHEMAKGGGGLLSAAAAAAGAASSSSLLQQLQLQQQQRKPSAAATAALTPMSN